MNATATAKEKLIIDLWNPEEIAQQQLMSQHCVGKKDMISFLT